jgi:hypothetical protein
VSSKVKSDGCSRRFLDDFSHDDARSCIWLFHLCYIYFSSKATLTPCALTKELSSGISKRPVFVTRLLLLCLCRRCVCNVWGPSQLLLDDDKNDVIDYGSRWVNLLFSSSITWGPRRSAKRPIFVAFRVTCYVTCGSWRVFEGTSSSKLFTLLDCCAENAFSFTLREVKAQ